MALLTELTTWYICLHHRIHGLFTGTVPEACQLQEGLLLLVGGKLGSTEFLSKEI